MLKILAALTITAFVLASGPSAAQQPMDKLGVPGPVAFNGKEFSLAWMSNPSPTYIKQEYLPDGQDVKSYGEMFIIEAVTSGSSPASAAGAQVEALKKRKGSDPVVNYEIIQHPSSGDILLDFLISDASSGQIIVEWNAYRYTKQGKDGVALYAISTRGYGDGAKPFLANLKTSRPAAIKALADMTLPPLKPAP